jgi:hypothetical protein
MNRGEIEKLLGGYATGTLTDQERRTLLGAALEDQELFNALGNEEALRELLSDPVSLAKLRAALEPARQTGWFSRPLPWALAGSCAAALLTIGIAWRLLDTTPPPAPAEMAKLSPAVTGRAPSESVPAPVLPQQPAPRAARRDAPVQRTKPAAVQPRAEAEAEKKAGKTAEARSEQVETAQRALSGRATFAVTDSVAERAIVPMRSAAPSASALLPVYQTHPAFDCKILRRTDAGLWEETPPDSAFGRGDAVRLAIVSRTDAELEVRQRTQDGVWRPVSPAGHQRIQAGAVYTLPPAGQFEFEGEPLRFSITVKPDRGPPASVEITLPAAR